MGPRRPVARSFGASVERGLHVAIGLVLLAHVLVFLLRLGPVGDLDQVERLSALAVVLCVGTAALRCLGRGPSGFDILLGTVAMTVAALLPREGMPQPGAADSPVAHLVAPLLLVLAVRRVRPVPPMLALLALFVALRWSGDGTTALVSGLEEAALVGAGGFAMLALATRMRGASARADARLDSHREVHRAHLSIAEVETTAFLHDDLVPTLLAVGSLPHSPDTAAAAAAALARLTGPGHGEDTADVVTALRAAAAREMLDVQVVAKGPRTHLPEAVREAMLGAAVEALRNVARHSGQRRATVTVVRRPTALRIRVEDNGAGFTGTQGVGIRVAILGRLESIGGTARVTGAPGAGTVVELGWRARLLARLLGQTPDLDGMIRAAVGAPGRVAREICAILAAGALTTGLLLARDGDAQAWAWAGGACLIGLVLVLTAAMDRGPVHPALLAPVAVVPAAALGLALPSGTGWVESWIVLLAVLPVLAVAWVVSGRMVLLLLVPGASVIALEGLPELLPVQPVAALVVAVVVAVCRRAGRVLSERSRPEVTAHAAAVTTALGPILRPVVVALRTVGTPDAPVEPAPALLAQAVRDCLYLPGPGHEELRTAIDALRRAGIQVDTIITEPPAATRTLAAALATVASTGPTQVTISGTAEEMTVVAVPGPSEELVERLPRLIPVAWQVTADAEVCVLTGPPDLATLIRRGDRRRVRD